jgi:MinD superfamily P-loop ATPase
MEIPFDRRIAEAYSRGEPLVEQNPEWKDKFLGLFHRVNQIIEERK